jgi:hypothetical protein
VWDPALPTRLLTDASDLAVSVILEQSDDAGAFHPIALESLKLTQPERLYPPHLLELLAVVHALKTPSPYLLDKPFELRVKSSQHSHQWRVPDASRNRLPSVKKANFVTGEYGGATLRIYGAAVGPRGCTSRV